MAAPSQNIGETTPGIVPWPKPINQAGMYGIAGEFVRLVEPHTEADPNAILLAFLTFAGNLIGRKFFTYAGSDQHCGNLYLCLVGNTGQGRKGSAISTVEAFFKKGSPPQLGHLLKGISSGEGVIWQIHDDVYKTVLDKKSGEPELKLVEKNIPDKRLLIILPEFQQCLAIMKRPDSTLSAILRLAWDRDELHTPSKNSPAIATGAHVSVIAAISRSELLQEIKTADAENGTLNRLLFTCCRRSKLLPQGRGFAKLFQCNEWRDLQERLTRNIESLKGCLLEMEQDAEASQDWGLNDYPEQGMYKSLNQPRSGIWGAVTARAPQMVLRMALITAAINGDRQMTLDHMDAGYECWRYCDESARYVFGDQLDNPITKEIMNCLRAAGSIGMTRTQIARSFGNHKTRFVIDKALQSLAARGIARCEKNAETGGRPVETWYEST